MCLRSEYEQGKVRSRPLLLPSHQTVTEAQASLFEKEGQLNALGLNIRRVGPHTVALREIPIALEQADASSIVAVLIEFLCAPGSAIAALLEKLSNCIARESILTDSTSLSALLGTMESLNIEPPHPPICRCLGANELARLLGKNDV